MKFGRWFYPSRRRLLSNNLSIAELQELQSQGHAIDEELASWGASQSSSWMPTIVGTITQLSASKSSIAYCHAGTVHRYVDCKDSLVNDDICTIASNSYHRLCRCGLEYVSQVSYTATRLTVTNFSKTQSGTKYRQSHKPRARLASANHSVDSVPPSSRR